MIDMISKMIEKQYHVQPTSVKPLGGGFYGRVFEVGINTAPYLLAVKLYLFTGLASKEAEQIRVLSQNGPIKMPTIYKIGLTQEENYRYDYIIMEYLDGTTLGSVDISKLPGDVRERISHQIVGNLIAYHDTSNPKGFGEINGTYWYTTWQEYYYPIACGIAEKAHALYQKRQITGDILSVINKSIAQFQKLFRYPIDKSSLIHGDYNTWNILWSEDKKEVSGVIDPFHSCWADYEYDLYHLDNVNGKQLGLLNLYRQKRKLSSNFEEKRRFYELFSELDHYYNARVTVDLTATTEQAKRLNELL